MRRWGAGRDQKETKKTLEMKEGLLVPQTADLIGEQLIHWMAG